MSATITTTADLDLALDRLVEGEPAALAEPNPTWSELREHRLYRHRETVLVTRYEDLKALHKDPRASRRALHFGFRAEAVRRE